MASAASVIIPALNEEGYLPRLLESLEAISSPLDIIVVDGASTDATCEVVEEFGPHFTGTSSLTLIRSEKRGTSLQRNMGAEKAKYDTLIFCDADVVFPPGTYEKMLTDFSAKRYAVAAPLLLPTEPGFCRKVKYHALRSAQRLLVAFRRPYFPGACLLTTKKAFAGTGGFDTNVVLGEDVDYSVRAAKFGSFGLLNVKISVSDRRFMKYGYGWILAEIPNVVRLLVTGKLKPETIYYPFGAYGGQEAHHVTGNTGR